MRRRTLAAMTQASALAVVASEVLGETAVAPEPGEGALDHPAAWFGLEGPDALRAGYNLDRSLAAIGDGTAQFVAAIDAIGEDVAQGRERAPDRLEQGYRAMVVLHIGGVHQQA